jgi:hypothetical protein
MIDCGLDAQMSHFSDLPGLNKCGINVSGLIVGMKPGARLILKLVPMNFTCWRSIMMRPACSNLSRHENSEDNIFESLLIMGSNAFEQFIVLFLLLLLHQL